jgi:hypothetical protein
MSSQHKTWVDDDIYEVYDDGRIYSKFSNRFLTLSNRRTYLTVNLRNIGKRSGKQMFVHRMVAIMFCSNPDNKPLVDHIDRNPRNNHYTNLRWVTSTENAQNSDKNNFTQKVHLYSVPDDELMYEFNSIAEAVEQTGINRRKLYEYCTKKQQRIWQDTLYLWMYPEERKKSDIPENSKKITDYPAYYLTNNGRVYSVKRKTFMKNRISGCGYVSIGLRCKGKTTKLSVHRLVAELFIENKPENYRELQINHKDGNKLNNHVSNLEYVTAAENSQHSKYILYPHSCTETPLLDGRFLMIFTSITEAANYMKMDDGNFGKKYKKILAKNPDKVPTVEDMRKSLSEKGVKIIDKKTGKINIFGSVRDAAKYADITPSSLYRICHGIRRSIKYNISYID